MLPRAVNRPGVSGAGQHPLWLNAVSLINGVKTALVSSRGCSRAHCPPNPWLMLTGGPSDRGLPCGPWAEVVSYALISPSLPVIFHLVGLSILLGHWNLMEARVCHLARCLSFPD